MNKYYSPFNLLEDQSIFLLLPIDRINFGPKHFTIFALIYTCSVYAILLLYLWIWFSYVLCKFFCLNSQWDRSVFYFLVGEESIYFVGSNKMKTFNTFFYNVLVFKLTDSKIDFFGVYRSLNFNMCVESSNTTTRTHNRAITPKTPCASLFESHSPPPLTLATTDLLALCHYRFVWFELSHKWHRVVCNLSNFSHSARCLWESPKLCVSTFEYWTVSHVWVSQTLPIRPTQTGLFPVWGNDEQNDYKCSRTGFCAIITFYFSRAGVLTQELFLLPRGHPARSRDVRGCHSLG